MFQTQATSQTCCFLDVVQEQPGAPSCSASSLGKPQVCAARAQDRI